MSDLRARLRALRGEASPDELEARIERPAPSPSARDVPPPPGASRPEPGPGFGGPAAQLGAEVIPASDGLHLRRAERWPVDARLGNAPLGGAGLDVRLGRWAARAAPTPLRREGSVVYLDTETTGLAGGTGTFVFLVGVGRHDADGFEVRQYLLPAPQYELGYLRAVHASLARASFLVSYNGASFDLPLLRTRFALHGMDDPTEGVPHLDLLPLARRLWRERLPDCRLGTVEREVLGAVRSERDVPGAEVPMRYLAFLRSGDAGGLRGVLEHNRTDIVALSALRGWIEARLEPGRTDDADEAYALARWLAALGEPDEALAHLATAEATHHEAAWEAARLLRKAGRLAEAAERWERLARRDDPRAWIALAKHHEHRRRDARAALAAAEAARLAGGDALDDLERRIERLRARLRR